MKQKMDRNVKMSYAKIKTNPVIAWPAWEAGIVPFALKNGCSTGGLSTMVDMKQGGILLLLPETKSCYTHCFAS
jgi:hypothetical protein